MFFYPALEIITIAFKTEDVWGCKHGTSIPGHHELVGSLSDRILEKRMVQVDISAERKVQIFKEAVELRNKYGWSFNAMDEVKNAVCLTKPYLKQIKGVFELNPQLSALSLTTILWECIFWSKQEPEEKEKHYWARLGVDLGTFCRKLDLIVAELNMREECPVSQL